VLKVYSLTGHLSIPEIFVFSKRTWDTLSKEDQALGRKLSREAQMEQRQLWDAAVADYTAKLKAEGVEFIAMDNKPFFDATAPVRAKYGAQFADLMKRIEAVK
jgi:TRAP-type C4-dicarboxylate transport system substrate-binding protein